METPKKELFISYKREPVSTRLANDLKALIELHFPFLHVMLDTKEVRTGASIKAYMDRLTQGNYIIFLLSPAFLESHWCMYELALTADYPDFKDRVFHVRLPGIQISTPGEVAKISKAWQQRWKELKVDMDDIAGIDESHLAPEFADELRIAGEIVRGSGRALLHMQGTVGLAADANGEIDWTEMLEYLGLWVKAPAAPEEIPQTQYAPPIQQLLDDMLPIPAAEFTMGDDRYADTPRRKVQLDAFQLGRHPVTQAQWQAVMGENPAHFKADDAPVENVSWRDCQAFLEKLNAETGREFRLPTEAEWEYAACATTTPEPALAAVAIYDGNSGRKSQAIGGRQANAFGLQDMLGNVFEWCQDSYAEDAGDDLRVIRGGAWLSHASDCDPRARHNEHADTRHPAIGLRLAES
jgi:formylglycine-generating enzyme required for sulfatase activity